MQQQEHSSHNDENSPHKGEMHDRGVTHMQTDEEMKMTTEQTHWIYWTFIILGTWLIVASLTFDFAKNIVEPSGGRTLWLTLEERINFSKWSEAFTINTFYNEKRSF